MQLFYTSHKSFKNLKAIVEIILFSMHWEHLEEIWKYENTLNKNRKRETVSYRLLLPPEYFCQTSFLQNDLVLLADIES